MWPWPNDDWESHLKTLAVALLCGMYRVLKKLGAVNVAGLYSESFSAANSKVSFQPEAAPRHYLQCWQF
jgi:hypothetical protein